MNKINIVAAMLLSSSLLAHKEVVREITRDIQRSDYQSAKVHLDRLKHEDLSQEQYKSIMKEFKNYAKEVRAPKEEFVAISNSWVDSLTTIGGLLVSLYGIHSGFRSRRVDDWRESTFAEYEVLQRGRPVFRPTSLSSKTLGLLKAALGYYIAYNGYKCWYQNKGIAAAKKVEELLDTYSEVKEG